MKAVRRRRITLDGGARVPPRLPWAAPKGGIQSLRPQRRRPRVSLDFFGRKNKC